MQLTSTVAINFWFSLTRDCQHFKHDLSHALQPLDLTCCYSLLIFAVMPTTHNHPSNAHLHLIITDCWLLTCYHCQSLYHLPSHNLPSWLHLIFSYEPSLNPPQLFIACCHPLFRHTYQSRPVSLICSLLPTFWLPREKLIIFYRHCSLAVHAAQWIF